LSYEKHQRFRSFSLRAHVLQFVSRSERALTIHENQPSLLMLEYVGYIEVFAVTKIFLVKKDSN